MLLNSPFTRSPGAALPFVPRRFDDETIWSWVSRIALYYGWTADELLSLLQEGEVSWDGSFRDPDVDVDPPAQFVARLSTFTGVPQAIIRSWQVTRVSSLLWMDDRGAFCPACWSSPGSVPYIKMAWLDAWTVDCAIHKRPLISIRPTRRARRLPDWSIAWGAEAGWARAANVRHRRRQEGPRVEVPPTLNRLRHHWSAADTHESLPVHVTSPANPFERELVLLAGDSCAGFSLARAYYDLRDDLRWRNTPEGFDSTLPITEPLGSLSLRAAAIVIGASLYDLMTGTTVRDPDTANPLRKAISEIYGRPRHWLASRILQWPAARRRAWSKLFEWPTESECRQVTLHPLAKATGSSEAMPYRT
ncbi:hypothetical protein GCM10011487_54240 [Steroidobacter agaridevorans]|uniref:TniQ domain-containing protein n=1 Tax=Steroidobacter agaridevorans TaxID=2695856 RepID=A0A829YJ76_9GAMM|nr:TniQ family protein [Steroidobacter agaridevorans]GFE83424.1 hypothetical protein GCM10011487_54240 [Steroidobacter agaridevorans]